MKRFNRWFAAPVVFGALVVFSGCFAQTEPAPGDEKGDNNENVGEVQSAWIGQSCNVRMSGQCTGSPAGACCPDIPISGTNGTCVDFQTNNQNCGSCGHVCSCTGALHPSCTLGGCACIP